MPTDKNNGSPASPARSKTSTKQSTLGSFFGKNAQKVEPVSPAEKVNVAHTPPKKRRRGVIADSDEEEDVEGPARKVEEIKEVTPQDAVGDIAVAEQEEMDEEQEEMAEKAVASKLAKLVDQKPMVVDKLQDKKIPYATLCKTFALIESTTKRLEILEHITNLFRSVVEATDGDAKTLLQILYLCINKLCPDYEGLELGIGESLLMKAITESTGRTLAQIRKEYHESGDLGTVAKNSRSAQKTLFASKPLSAQQVYSTLKEIAQITGGSSQAKKVGKIKGLLVACREDEAKYLIRQLEGKLRIGLAEKTVLAALAQSVTIFKSRDKKAKSLEQQLASAVDVVKAVYSEIPSYDLIVPALFEYPVEKLAEVCKMTPGIPIKPMLAHPTKSLTEVLDRFEGHTFSCEFKYDGERAQIHRLADGKTFIYSRNSENMSQRYPDIIDKLPKANSKTSFVLDCEAVAWDKVKQCLLPFQVLSTRKRKDVKEEEITVQVCVYAFDCLFYDGKPLLKEPFATRRSILHQYFNEVQGEFSFARNIDTTQIDDIQHFLDTSIEENCEGLMVKMLDGEESTYEPSKRSRNWLKVKKDYLTGIGDSLDLVVIGAFHGRGKRTAVYGAYLLACYDPDREEYQTITKIGTGFSDEALSTHYTFFKDHVIDGPKRYYAVGDNGIKPDVWFEPVQVWEVLAADLSISPRYQAAVGIVDGSKGISLRFPRFIRVRDDKKPEHATSSEQVAEFYNRQMSFKAKDGGAGGDADDDFEY
ncbi:hypothetical protein BZG36_01579 [Bifiguratus adelaidae]|uniref:DNA ligase n=1 Tax=Bifiguratus adelaidae TaxID=1938954 RepID=A0A261Y452_9FUNG|nr:hypothetical protein BZG36_01579 [Bifiguratus adelaidae]